MRRALVVLAALAVVAAAFTAGALIFRDDGDGGWSQADERKFLDRIVVSEHTEPGNLGKAPGGTTDLTFTRVVPGNEEWAACTLEVYEEYFSTYDEWADASDDSPTLLKADAAAQRRCT
jgi:hypothetical protein